GEIRDEETAGLAIHSALTGHILLSTIHTNNAVGVIPRLIDMGISSFLIPASMNLAIAQRLVRRLCPHCKKEIAAPQPIVEEIEKSLASLPPGQEKDFPYEKPFKIYRPIGCKFCNNKGTKGRLALYEMLKMTPQMEGIINEGMNETKMNEEAKRQGMLTMKQDGVNKALQGLISFEEMLRVVEE
ncbi:MAG: Flp pilus assembly complex ATPase component TadA, partial [Candidatus Portnoybacteria bacterium]|nr:Flp pilus assembly complex ATPase component TadA [Candidatus Portnoybacteria bacterium]